MDNTCPTVWLISKLVEVDPNQTLAAFAEMSLAEAICVGAIFSLRSREISEPRACSMMQPMTITITNTNTNTITFTINITITILQERCAGHEYSTR